MSALLNTAFYLQGQDLWHVSYCRAWFGDSMIDSDGKWWECFNSVRLLPLKLGRITFTEIKERWSTLTFVEHGKSYNSLMIYGIASLHSPLDWRTCEWS